MRCVARVLVLTAGLMLAAGTAPASANPVRLLKTIAINGTATAPATKMFSFGSGFVDPASGLYYLADRSNAAIDVVDTRGAFTGTPDTLYGQIGGPAFAFAGDTGSSASSGPNGVVAAYPCVFATNYNGRVFSIDASKGHTMVSLIRHFFVPLGPPLPASADQLAYDPKDGLLLAINSADSPPFGTLISVDKATCALTLVTELVFAASHGVNATSGAGQPVWEPITQRFYLSIPEFDGDAKKGGIAQINPLTVTTVFNGVEGLYQVNYCRPAGLAVGPNGDLLVGCSAVFDTSGNICSTVVPAPSPAGTETALPATCMGIANPQTAILNPGRGGVGNALVAVPGAGGGDEVWFNSGDSNYYVTAANDPKGPVFGVIQSVTNILTQVVPTLPPVPMVTAAPGVTGAHSSGAVHSIAASAANNHVYVPLPANTDYPDCVQGCIRRVRCSMSVVYDGTRR
jgi:hypothetical protein